MKKLLLSCTLAFAGALTALSAVTLPHPDKLYLSGSFNNDAFPANQNPQYALTDENQDGIYTGTFTDINGYMPWVSFCVWSENTAVEEKSVRWLLPSNSPELNQTDLYSDISLTYHLYPQQSDAATTGGIYASIGNVVNNTTLSFSARFMEINGEVSLAVTVTSPTQPKLSSYPANAYLVGDWNNWAEPAGDSSAKTMKLSRPNPENALLEGEFEIPADFGNFKIYLPATEGTNSAYLANTNLSGLPFVLHTTQQGQAYYNSRTIFSNEEYEIIPMSFALWNGGKIFFRFHPDNNMLTLFSEDAPEYPEINEMYAIVTHPDNSKELLPVNKGGVGNFYISINNFSKGSVLFTTENSLTPAKENTFGRVESIPQSTHPFANDIRRYDCIYSQGGLPIEIDTDGTEYVSLFLQETSSILTVQEKYPTIETPEHLYLIGNMQSPIWDIDNGIELTRDSETVFSGVLDVKANSEIIFRFVNGLGSWDATYSYGCQREDTAIEFPATYSGKFMKEAKGSWQIKDFPGDKLYVRLDFSDITISFSDKPLASVESIENDSDNTLSVNGDYVKAAGASRIEVYDAAGRLAGTSVNGSLYVGDLAKGIYIARTSATTLKFTR